MSQVVISEFMDETAVASLQGRFSITYDAALAERRDALLAAVVDADALIVRNKTRVDAELIAAANKLRVVGRLGVGLDNIDLAACEARGIEVIPATGANALAVAEYVMGTTLVLLRGAYFSTASVGAGQWPRAALGQGREVHGKILGVVGFGSVGRATARIGCALGMTTIGFDAHIPSAAEVWGQERTAPRRFDDLLREADVVSLHVPLTPATRGLIDAEKLSLMKREAILVNTDTLFQSRAARIAALAVRHKMPAMSSSRRQAAQGYLITYGTNAFEMYRQVGIYVGRILRGDKPGDLPVLQPTAFELVINLKTAKALGLQVPATLLALADEVIE